MKEQIIARKTWRIPNYKAQDDKRPDSTRRGTFEITAKITKFANQEPYFGLTGYYKEPGRDGGEFGGCCHDEIMHAMPELEKYIKWHLCSTAGPMHYLANTIFLASNADPYGKRAGEATHSSYGVRFANSPITHRVKPKFWHWLQERQNTGDFQTIAVAHENKPGDYVFSPKYTLVGFDCQWYECPFDDLSAATEFAQSLNTCSVEYVTVPDAWSNGKARELDSARHVAIWPDATDAELSVSSDELKAVLIARLPALLDAFQADMSELFGDQIEWIKKEVTDN